MDKRYWSTSAYLDYLREDHRAKLKALADAGYVPVRDDDYTTFERVVGEHKLCVWLHSKTSPFSKLTPDAYLEDIPKERYTSPVRRAPGKLMAVAPAFLELCCTTLHVAEDLVTAEGLKRLLNRFWQAWQESLYDEKDKVEGDVLEALQADDPKPKPKKKGRKKR